MAVTVKEGDVLSLEDTKSGEGANGAWFRVRVQEGHERIDVWANNAAEAMNFRGKAKVKRITAVKKGKNKWNEKWYDTYSLNADLEEVIGFSRDELEAVDDSELPFN